jgi:SNF2 family DNA or RNA helicase
MNTISVWKDKIILRWDGQVPPSIPAARVKHPQNMLAFWPKIRDYCKWNERFNGFLLNFSKQNLGRLKQQFPNDLTLTGPRDQIDRLKELNRFFVDVQHAAITTKGSPFLPSINYKVPPLGAYQDIGVHYLLNNPLSPLFADCGTGKTFCALVSTELQIKNGIIARGKTLITGKLATLRTAWLADCKKFTNLSATVLWEPQSSKRRAKILKKMEEPSDIFIINHEGVIGFEEELIAMNFQKVIVDESTILKGFHGMYEKIKGGRFGRSLMRVSRNAKWRVVMSGTPAPNGPQDLWGQMYFLSPDGLILDPSFNDFRVTYMNEIYFGKPVPGRERETPKTWVIKKEAIDQLSSIIEPLAYRVKIRDHLHDLPEKTIIPRKISMGKKQEEHYEAMKVSLATTIDDIMIAASVKLTQLMKLRQITGGFIIDYKEKPHPLEDNPKLDMLDSLVNDEIDQEHKIIIYAQYRWEIETISERYKDYGCVTVYGGNDGEQNLYNLEQFIANPKIRIIVLHPKSAAHGITLTMAHYMIFYSLSYSAEENYQAIKRIERAGQKHPMFIYYLICKAKDDSIDEVMYSVLARKDLNQSKLIDQDNLDLELLREWSKK